MEQLGTSLELLSNKERTSNISTKLYILILVGESPLQPGSATAR